MSSATLSQLLKRIDDRDQDFRYMALNDLHNGFESGSLAPDDPVMGRMIEAVLRSLEDKNGEVQNMAVRCLAPMVRRASEAQVTLIIERLYKGTGGGDESKDISPMALRTIIVTLPPTSPVASNVTKRLIPQITATLRRFATQQNATEQLLDTLEVTVELCSRFGSTVGRLESTTLRGLITVLQQLLDHPRPVVRKRSSTALGGLSSHLPMELFSALMSELVEMLSIAKSNDKLKVVFMLFGHVCEANSSARFGGYLLTVAPPVIESLQIDDDELREVALQTLETFTLHGGSALQRNDARNIDAALRLLTHDPNYVDQGDASDDDDMADADDASDLGSEFEDEQYSDDDDVSWKVRRASAKLLAALVASRSEDFSARLGQPLVARFSDREETVQVEVLAAYKSLVESVVRRSSGRSTSPSRKRPRSSDEMEVDGGEPLTDTVPRAVVRLVKLLAGKGVAVKQAALDLLLAIVSAGFSVSNEISAILPQLDVILAEREASVGNNAASLTSKVQALSFVQLWAETGLQRQLTLGSSLPKVRDMLMRSLAQDKSVRVISGAIDAARPVLAAAAAIKDDAVYGALIDALITEADRNDVDLEVKGKILTTLGHALSAAPRGANVATLSAAQRCLLAKLQNETSRDAALAALDIAGAAGRLDAAFASRLITEAAPLALSGSRPRRLATLSVLRTALASATALDPATVQPLAANLRSLLDAKDQQVMPAALSALAALCGDATAAQYVQSSMLDVLLATVDRSTPGTTSATHDLTAIFRALSRNADPQATIQAIMQSDLQLKQPQLSAELVAAAAASASQLSDFVKQVQAPKTPADQRIFALRVLGCFGRCHPLGPDVAQLLLGQFRSPDDQVKSAAAAAYGGLVAGDLPMYGSSLAQELPAATQDPYLTVVAIKQTIVGAYADAREALAASSLAIWNQLFSLATEERASNVTAECIGRLTLLRPSEFLPQLRQHIADQSSELRAVVLRAVKYTMSAEDREFDDLLRPLVVDFLSLMNDEDLGIRRLALGTLYTAAHNRPRLIREHLSSLMPMLYRETKRREDLIHIVNMGPFKHTVDDGLETRKAAFETMLVLLNNNAVASSSDAAASAASGPRIDIDEFVAHVVTGLDDPANEVKLLCQLMLVQVASLASAAGVNGSANLSSTSPGGVVGVSGSSSSSKSAREAAAAALISRSAELADKLAATLSAKLKDTAVKGDREKDDEVKKATLRCVYNVDRLLLGDRTPGASASTTTATAVGAGAAAAAQDGDKWSKMVQDVAARRSVEWAALKRGDDGKA